MPLTITTRINVTPDPILCTRQVLREQALRANNPFAARTTNVGVTVPHLVVGLSHVFFDRRLAPPPEWGPHANDPPTPQRRFGGGTLTLTLNQTVYLLQTLSPVEQSVWTEHERLHVADNERIVTGQLRAAVMADTSVIVPVFVQNQWFDDSMVSTVEESIPLAVAAIFQGLSGAAARARDTAAEYAGRMQRIRSLTPVRTPSPRATRAQR